MFLGKGEKKENWDPWKKRNVRKEVFGKRSPLHYIQFQVVTGKKPEAA